MKVEQKTYKVSPELISILKQNKVVFDNKGYDKKTMGYNLLSHITDNNGFIGGKYLKKIKHEYEQGDDLVKFLLGGERFFKWINKTLESKREQNARLKNAKKETGIQNSFIKPHSKDKNNGIPKISEMLDIYLKKNKLI